MMTNRFRPHEYQGDALSFMLRREAAGLFADPGMGKTAVALMLARKLQQRTLVVAPLRVAFGAWPQEINKWDQFRRSFSWQIMHDINKFVTDRRTFLPGLTHIDLINPEGLGWFEEWLETQPFDGEYGLLIIDESTLFKRWSSQRTKIMRRISKRFPRRYILTGTPTPNSMLNLFPQMYLLDEGAHLGKHVTKFQDKFFRPVVNRGRRNSKTGIQGKYISWEIRDGSEKKIQRLIKPICYRLDAEDWLDLPPIIHNEVPVRLNLKARNIYRTMERKLFAELNGVKVLAGSAAVSYGKCRQIATGMIYDRDGNVLDVHGAKIDALRELRDEYWGRPLLILYNFNCELEALRKEFGARVPVIHGKTPPKRAAGIQDAWNAREIDLMICQARTVAYGQNLQYGGNDMVWYSPTDDPEIYDQANWRLRRQGVDGTVRIHSLIATGTVERLITRRNYHKEERQMSLLNALKREIKIL
jgi:SNF2 family DNA or RNA helicase